VFSGLPFLRGIRRGIVSSRCWKDRPLTHVATKSEVDRERCLYDLRSFELSLGFSSLALDFFLDGQEICNGSQRRPAVLRCCNQVSGGMRSVLCYRPLLRRILDLRIFLYDIHIIVFNRLRRLLAGVVGTGGDTPFRRSSLDDLERRLDFSSFSLLVET
jgi:hypothetical protein